MNREAKLQELENARARVRELEQDLYGDAPPQHWQARGYYAAYFATTGAMLGLVAGLVSLLFNVAGSMIWSNVTDVAQHPLRLIQVYLTFPMGERALSTDGGVLLAIGCALYVGTGMLYGMVFQLVLTRFLPSAGFIARILVASLIGLAIWLINFYGILTWLQPALIGGNWIVELVPPWVAALTHLVFAWTMALLYPLGLYKPYRLQVETR